MNPPSSDSKYVWIDLEFTDLDPEKGKIVEIATIITDGHLNEIAVGPEYVIHQPQEIVDNLPHWQKEHFAESGLIEDIKSSSHTLEEAETATLSFIKKHCSEHNALLAGNSVHVDKMFLDKYFPKITEYLHYRMIDASVIKELCRHWYPHITLYKKEEKHRSLPDIRESIEELKYYRKTIFK